MESVLRKSPPTEKVLILTKDELKKVLNSDKKVLINFEQTTPLRLDHYVGIDKKLFEMFGLFMDKRWNMVKVTQTNECVFLDEFFFEPEKSTNEKL